jgi:hypothetical protein
MAKFQLTTWDRLTISGLVGQLRGDAALMHKAIKVFDAVDLTEEENAEINMRQIGPNAIQWDQPDRKWEIEIKDKEAANLIVRVVKENTTWQAVKAREIAGLHEALGLPWPPPSDEPETDPEPPAEE